RQDGSNYLSPGRQKQDRRYQKVNLGRGRRPADLTGPYFLRYSLADGTRPWEHVGDDLDEAIAARDRKQAYFEALEANVPVNQDRDDTARKKITDARINGWPSFSSCKAKTSKARVRRR